ncbi:MULTISPECIES: gliding motility-associated peptidyl-prolyl isomerase GldI [Myroides]|uniref:Peptidyl-prolyl cis-trans isomerase n=1 Tax=Myroides albus TaxID=2562892 RepID=A0A6I3LNG4_9FLAO|nr:MULTISPECIES: gliding motility-associated peptidyl-prolyl isomerase GldI [Myroides]MTG98141.1 gliding motility-associated peptidyl-prolyl isomerase GldI [Myroides albus]MVX35429.1 gliding motility-associated peptidyl-prolyl isomerase GldI [Myroides sp. LoEW2-1]UVD78628.1 gliding motility-associated peptidyl-prolyl isomerase GldI [Myroides albus]
MIKTLKFAFCLLSLFTLTACFQQEQARKPISEKRSTVIDNSIDRNKNLLESEEAVLSHYISSNKDQQFLNSKNGFWYAYQNRQIKDSILPQKGDKLIFTYEVKSMNDSLIYDKSEIGNIEYTVDQDELLPILRQSLKLMKQKEILKVLTPSSLAYSYLGDKDKIQKNQPLIFVIELKSIEK